MKLKLKLTKEKCIPLSLTALIIIADQLVKAFIARNWPINTMIKDVFNNDLLQIYHVRNKVIAFSLGAGIPEAMRPALFIILPLLVLGFLFWYYLRSDDFSRLQRWAVAGIIGGGLGNIIDRIFRPDGVVDFISVKFFGLFGFERWPTFNIADSCVVVGCILLLVTIFISPGKNKGASGNEQET
ncbi:MAG: signal peptidase II [Treponema sp.]|jgi:signal peptidase II|nr:signal peptidase II [Treponema sp.]